MSTVFVISLVVPFAVGAALLAARDRLPKLAAETRGIALQTVIVMVVLLAIAGGVATVLLSRGSDAIEEVEQQNITIASRFNNSSAACVGAGFDWTAGTAAPTGTCS